MLIILTLYLAMLSMVAYGSMKSAPREEFYTGGRKTGSWVLLLTLFATNMTSISLIGVPDQAFDSGFMVFISMGVSTALIVPFLFHTMGRKVCEQSRRYGFLTQGDLVHLKTGSKSSGAMISSISILFLIPYIVIGLKGGGEVLSLVFSSYQLTIPEYLSTGVIALLVFGYVFLGGMTTTSRINTVQAIIFLVGAFYIATYLFSKWGGFSESLHLLQTQKSGFFNPSDYLPNPGNTVSLAFLAISVGAFPHIFSHWCTAKSPDHFKQSIRLYPACILILWLSSSFIGMLSNLEFAQKPDEPVIIALIGDLNNEFVAGIIAVSVLAAIMSSLDSQLLGASLIFQKSQKSIEKMPLAIMILLCYALAICTTGNIFQLGVWSLAGFAALTPLLMVCVRQNSVNKVLFNISLAVIVILWLGFFMHALAVGFSSYSILDTGIAPVVPLVVISALFSLLLVVTNQKDTTQKAIHIR
ncbi:sodium:solute symporter family protein [Endozoicomonas numazuensis]|uniref:Sodium:solute symporter n=1 Tax=Endozoicomonas numazuensis TaxID=1137799 RepID=A0A081NDC1_9GAMM|nr:hypothetical protein [Endozoicomonas numazuensis]KEQ16444.1 hypothetical protein GZ78_21525 [Endozoicomonas numazuensis]